MRGYVNANLWEITSESTKFNNPEREQKKSALPFGPLVEYLRKCGFVH